MNCHHCAKLTKSGRVKFMKITCVIVNYNDYKTTTSLVTKIRDYNCLYKIIVVDNNSKDDSYAQLQKISSEKVVILKAPKNGGYGYGNNLGIRYSNDECNSDYTIIANPDVFFTEHCVKSMVNGFKVDSKIAAVSTREKFKKTDPDDNNIKYAWRYTSNLNDVLSTSLLFNKLGKARYYSKTYFENKEFCYVDALPGAMLMVNTKVMVTCGMYDEEFFLFEEEKTLGYRLRENGYSCALILSDYFLHQHSVLIKKEFSSLTRRKKILLKSRRLFVKKYRKFNVIQMVLANIFFEVTIIEMFVYSILLRLKSK